MAKRRYRKKKGVDWKGHLIDVLKPLVPLLIVGALGLYVAVEQLKSDILHNKDFYAQKFSDFEKGQNNLSNWLKYISDKLDRHVEKE